MTKQIIAIGGGGFGRNPGEGIIEKNAHRMKSTEMLQGEVILKVVR